MGFLVFSASMGTPAGPERHVRGDLKMADTSSLVAEFSRFAALLAGISVATERVVEIIKGAVPPLANAWARHDKVRAAILQLIAAVSGAVIAWQMPDHVKNTTPTGWGDQLHWQTYALIGLMASGGSGAWNHVLDILGALKTKQEASTQASAFVSATPAESGPSK